MIFDSFNIKKIDDKKNIKVPRSKYFCLSFDFINLNKKIIDKIIIII